jgi:serine acetyltransferase
MSPTLAGWYNSRQPDIKERIMAKHASAIVFPIAIGVGAAIGAGLGVALKNIALGMGIGTAVGAVMGAALAVKKKRTTDESVEKG